MRAAYSRPVAYPPRASRRRLALDAAVTLLVVLLVLLAAVERLRGDTTDATFHVVLLIAVLTLDRATRTPGPPR